MNIFLQLISALNQSFRLLLDSIYRGVEFVIRSIKKSIILIGRLIKKLHDVLTFLIQFAINISAFVFVFFIPYAFFFDPLNWSRHLLGVFRLDVVFWGRMVIGSFFSLVAYFQIAGLIKSWSKISTTTEGGDQASSDFVRSISAFLSWLVLLCISIYYFIFRLEILPLDLRSISLPSWLRALMSP